MGDADRAAIASILRDQDTAWSRGDAAAFCALMSPDVTFTNVVGKHARGLAAFEGGIRAVLEGMYQGSSYRQFVQDIGFVHPDVAVVDTVAVLQDFIQAPPGAQAEDGNIYQRPQQVMVRRPEGWRVAAFHNVIILPLFLADALASIDPNA